MTTTCPQCKGYGTYLNSFGAVRRCGTCKGKKVVDQATADRIGALQLLHQTTWSCPDKSVAGDASLGLGLLRDREPEREDAMVQAILDGKVISVVRYLAAYYREAYPA